MAYAAGAKQVRRAADILFSGWVCSLAWYWAAEGEGGSWGYAVIDFTQAVAFWRMGAGSVFPAPLFWIHSGRIVFHAIAELGGLDPYWLVLAANRSFEAELIYIIACGAYRYWRRRNCQQP